MVTCRLPGNYCIKLYMYVNELWNVGLGRGSWAVSKNIIMIQLLKSIRIKDNINYRDVFSTYVRETSL